MVLPIRGYPTSACIQMIAADGVVAKVVADVGMRAVLLVNFQYPTVFRVGRRENTRWLAG